jgi:hypothetical protein
VPQEAGIPFIHPAHEGVYRQQQEEREMDGELYAPHAEKVH